MKILFYTCIQKYLIYERTVKNEELRAFLFPLNIKDLKTQKICMHVSDDKTFNVTFLQRCSVLVF